VVCSHDERISLVDLLFRYFIRLCSRTIPGEMFVVVRRCRSGRRVDHPGTRRSGDQRCAWVHTPGNRQNAPNREVPVRPRPRHTHHEHDVAAGVEKARQVCLWSAPFRATPVLGGLLLSENCADENSHQKYHKIHFWKPYNANFLEPCL